MGVGPNRVWQIFDDRCHSSHSWQDTRETIITAMTLLLILLALLLTLAIASLRHDLLVDARGYHPPPRSRDDEAELRTSVLRRLA